MNNKHSIVIYGSAQCEFCAHAVNMCKARNFTYEYKSIEYKIYQQELFEVYGKEIGVSRPGQLVDCPYIVWHGKYIGHYNEFLKTIEETVGGYGEGGF
jgi:glutaredoxin